MITTECAIKADAPCASLSFPAQRVSSDAQDRLAQIKRVHNELHAKIRSQRSQTTLINAGFSVTSNTDVFLLDALLKDYFAQVAKMVNFCI